MSFDPIGTAVLIPDVICLLLALQWGGTTYVSYQSLTATFHLSSH